MALCAENKSLQTPKYGIAEAALDYDVSQILLPEDVML